MSEPGIEAIRQAWSQVQDAADRAGEKIRQETAARQADAWADLKSRQAAFPENRAPEAPANEPGLREALRQAQGALKGAELRLRDALEAGSRGQSHCTDVRKRLAALDETERKHAASLASVLRAGGPGDQLPPAVIEARAARPGAERDAAAADEACSELASDIAESQREVDDAHALLGAAVRTVAEATVRLAYTDSIAENRRLEREKWRELKTVSMLWFGGGAESPGAPLKLDAVARDILATLPAGGLPALAPQVEASLGAAATGRWRAFFAALLVDAEAELDTGAA
jgi:hypothetical protein